MTPILEMKLVVKHQKSLIYAILRKQFGDDRERWAKTLTHAIPIFEKDESYPAKIAATEILEELKAQ